MSAPFAGGFSGVVAVDGPSGTGKSTAARRLARRLGARYLDTGSMYRAATLAVLDRGVDPEDAAAVADVVARSVIEVTTDPEYPATSLDGRRVDRSIRSPRTTEAVSAVSAVPAVRRQLVAQQREIIGSGGIVVEGRDIGTVVWPAAAPKIYLTASADQRARRRAGEQPGSSVAEVGAALVTRDRLDSSRATSPLSRAADAVEIDTSELTAEQTLERLLSLFEPA